MPLQPDGRAPYTTVNAATVAISAFRDRGLGLPITADVLTRAGVPESIARRTLQSLRELELVDKQGWPTDTFEAMRQARGDEEYKTLLQNWLRDVYADVLRYGDPSTDILDKIQEAFRTYEPAGQRKSMASLLVGLWRYAGLQVAATENDGSRPDSARQAQPRSPRKRTSQKPKGQFGPAVEGLSPGLVGLLHEIPKPGDSWTSNRRDSFLKAFEAILDFTTRVDDTPPQVAQSEEPEDES